MSSSRDSTNYRQPSQIEKTHSKHGLSSPLQVMASSLRRHPLDAVDLLSRVLLEWEIHGATHILLHLTNCDDCADFAAHVANQTQGRALEIFVDKQRRHWRRVLDEENKLDREEAFQAGTRSADREIDSLKDKLDWYYHRVEDLERENDGLHKRIHWLESRQNVQGSQFRRGEARDRISSIEYKRPQSPACGYECSQPLPVSSPSLLSRIEGKPNPPGLKLTPSTKGKEKEQIIAPEAPPATAEPEALPTIVEPEVPSTVVGPSPQSPSPPSDASSNIRVKGTGKAPKMYMTDDDDDDEISILDDEGPTQSDMTQEVEASPTSMVVDSVWPLQYSRYTGDQAPFRLDKKLGAYQSKHGHTCISQPMHWNCSSSALFEKVEHFKGYHLWVSGFPMQMAKEASLVPFDQWSEAQRWVVREATRDGFLPLLSMRAEPDVEKLAEENQLPPCLRQDPNTRINVKDVTAWLLLKMTEPEEPQLTEWFWWTSCTLFECLGAYREALDRLNRGDEQTAYIPTRLTFTKKITSDDVALHFHNCGVRVTDGASYLRDFSKNYLQGRRPPAPPAWSTLPPSRPRESRLSISQRKKCGTKAFTDRGQLPPHRIASYAATESVSGTSRSCQEEQFVQGSSQNDSSMQVNS
ncbi:hypothetical protein AX15_004891 [Amanita polypyramis BW_CC]|nr:hypothetical protein AX15_004891 [Amanita polypyramis BW_CC]